LFLQHDVRDRKSETEQISQILEHFTKRNRLIQHTHEKTELGELLTTSNLPVPIQLLDLLLAATKDKNPNVRLAAFRTLCQFKEECVVDALVKALQNDPVIAVRKVAAVSIGRLGTVAKKAIPDLIRTMRETSSYGEHKPVSCIGPHSSDCLGCAAGSSLV